MSIPPTTTPPITDAESLVCGAWQFSPQVCGWKSELRFPKGPDLGEGPGCGAGQSWVPLLPFLLLAACPGGCVLSSLSSFSWLGSGNSYHLPRGAMVRVKSIRAFEYFQKARYLAHSAPPPPPRVGLTSWAGSSRRQVDCAEAPAVQEGRRLPVWGGGGGGGHACRGLSGCFLQNVRTWVSFPTSMCSLVRG